MVLEIDRIGSESIAGESKSPEMSSGLYLPYEGIVTNEDIGRRRITTQSGKPLTPEEIQKKTGINYRFEASKHETPFYMLQEATANALGNRTDVDILLVSTSFPTGENMAGKLKDTFGLSTTYHADVHAACSGIPFMLTFLKKNEERVKGARVVLGTTEKYSDKVVDLQKEGLEKDPSMGQLLFSDGSVVWDLGRYGNDFDIIAYTNYLFPADVSSHLQMPVDLSKARSPALYIPIPYSEKFRQNGRNVYETVQQAVPGMVRGTVKKAGLKSEDVKYVFPHQGSGHMTRGIGKKLSEYTVAYDIEGGNFSSGSIAHSVLRALNGGEMKVIKNGELTKEHVQLQKGDIVVLAGFGAGLFASVAVVQL